VSTASDVVIVGGGIGGASLAYSLASEGKGVTVLEATSEYKDRVRGESMAPWGVGEARGLGVEEVLLAAGAHVAPKWKQYSEDLEEAFEIPMEIMVPGVPGTLNLRHPVACQALIDAATAAGATIVRGVRDVKLRAGRNNEVTYISEGDTNAVTAPLVVGADGRSSVVARQAGIALERQPPFSYIAGLLVEGLDGVPDDHDVIAGEGDLFFVMFHQGEGRARIYLCAGLSGRHRFAGPKGKEQFLADCDRSCLPFGELLAASSPAGPCATYPGDDTWTGCPYADGVVLIGDAAGHNDPIIGQGLSIAMRDVRIVRDLVLEGDLSSSAFSRYGEERSKRMQRLRLVADVMSVTHAEDAGNRTARRALVTAKLSALDPTFFPLLSGAFMGPETIPDELVQDGILEEIRNAR
jgi:2-polyprenyl-6-methoxyphenol hydroxylase-like FAD-dependent oxidoreductase